MKVLISVTHLLGTGHLARALVLGRSLVAAGHEATVVSGGMPVPHLQTDGVHLVQLPPVRSDGVNFAQLLDANGNPVSGATLAARQEMQRDCLNAFRPDVVITELFPFGRRVLAAEFLSLLDAVAGQSPRPAICASVRDILAPPSKPAKAEAARDIINTYYDAVLIHSDPDVAPLEASWPVTDDLAAKLRYTGFVAPAPAGPHRDGLGKGEVLVTTGGGSVGERLFETALAAARLDPDRCWRLLVGGSAADRRITRLREIAPPKARVSATTPDFRQMLYGAAASVSFCGYNTALDVLQAGTPTVFVPFDDGGEVEQSLRAASLAKLTGIGMLRTDDLTPEALLAKVNAVILAPRRAPRTEGLQGAARTVDVLSKLIAEKE
jgi:predicted glycosyltransferase